MKIDLCKHYFSETIGTFILAAVVLISLTPSTPFPIPTPIAAALTLTLCVYLFGDISGCHINPAVSFAMLIAKKITPKIFIFYLISQLIGAFLAYLMIKIYVLPGQEKWLVINHSTLYSGVGEAIGTAFFIFGVVATQYLKPNKIITPIIVGLSLLTGITISHNASYGVLNPAVAFATKAWSWHYLLMPFLGAIIGAILAKFIFDSGT